MKEDENKALIKYFYEEVWDKGNFEAAEKVFAEEYVRHDLRPGTAPPGPEGQKKIASLFRTAFPDFHLKIDLMIAEGELVAARWTGTGTHLGKWNNIEPTGKKVTFSAVNIFRINNGKVVEIWNHRDDMGLNQQIGSEVYAGYPDQRSTGKV